MNTLCNPIVYIITNKNFKEYCRNKTRSLSSKTLPLIPATSPELANRAGKKSTRKLNVQPSNLCQVAESPSNLCQVAESPSNLCQVTESPSNRCQVTESPSNIRQVTESPSNICQVNESPSNCCQVPESPSNLCKVTESPSSICQVTESPSNRCKVNESPSNRCQVTESPSNICQVNESPSNCCQVPESPSNRCQVTESPSSLCQVTESPSNRCKVNESPSNRCQVTESPSNRCQGATLPGNSYKIQDVPPRSPHLQGSPGNRHQKRSVDQNQSAAEHQKHFHSEDSPIKMQLEQSLEHTDLKEIGHGEEVNKYRDYQRSQMETEDSDLSTRSETHEIDLESGKDDVFSNSRESSSCRLSQSDNCTDNLTRLVQVQSKREDNGNVPGFLCHNKHVIAEMTSPQESLTKQKVQGRPKLLRNHTLSVSRKEPDLTLDIFELNSV